MRRRREEAPFVSHEILRLAVEPGGARRKRNQFYGRPAIDTRPIGIDPMEEEGERG